MFTLSEAVALVRGIEAGLVQIQGDIIEKSHKRNSLLLISLFLLSFQ